MKHLTGVSATQAEANYIELEGIAKLLDSFDITASHSGLILQGTGSSVQARMEDYIDGRLPRKVARNVARQVFQGSIACTSEELATAVSRLYFLSDFNNSRLADDITLTKTFILGTCSLRLLSSRSRLRNS